MTQLMNSLGFWNSSATRHTPVEDVQGIFTGSLVAALGLYLLASAGLLSHRQHRRHRLSAALCAWREFRPRFFLLNVPFFYLSWRQLGPAFTIKTFVAIGLTALISNVQTQFFTISGMQPAWGALTGGLQLGYGLLALYRHRASLGGVGILGVWMQERFGIRARPRAADHRHGRAGCRLLITPPTTVIYSVLGAVVLNLFIAINHRSDRYVAL